MLVGLEKGIPDCYENFKDSMYGFWPDLSWDESIVLAIWHILSTYKFQKTLDTVQEKFKFDFRKELAHGLYEHLTGDFDEENKKEEANTPKKANSAGDIRRK